MPRARNGNVEIEWQSFGDDRPEAILLVNGLGSQMTRWPEAFCEKLVAKGYRAIRFDNRDTGLSTWPTDKYTLTDMANDGVAVLDAAGVKKAHIAGVSMGGMIVQQMAIDVEKVCIIADAGDDVLVPDLGQHGTARRGVTTCFQVYLPRWPRSFTVVRRFRLGHESLIGPWPWQHQSTGAAASARASKDDSQAGPLFQQISKGLCEGMDVARPPR